MRFLHYMLAAAAFALPKACSTQPLDQDLDEENLAHGTMIDAKRALEDSSDSLTSLITPDTPVDALQPGGVDAWSYIGHLNDNDLRTVYVIWQVKPDQFIRFDLGHIQEVNTLYLFDTQNKRYNVKVKVYLSETVEGDNVASNLCYEGYRYALVKCQGFGRYLTIRHYKNEMVETDGGEWDFNQIRAYRQQLLDYDPSYVAISNLQAKFTDVDAEIQQYSGQMLKQLFGSSSHLGCVALTYRQDEGQTEHRLIFDLKQESEVDYVMITRDFHGIKNISKISVLLTDSLGNTVSCSDMDLTLLTPYARCDGSLGKRILLEFHPVIGVLNGDLNRLCKIGAFGTPSIKANPMTLQPLATVYPEQSGTYPDQEKRRISIIIIIVICSAIGCGLFCFLCKSTLFGCKEPEKIEQRPENTQPAQIAQESSRSADHNPPQLNEQERLRQVRLQELMPQPAQQPAQPPVSQPQRREQRPQRTRRESVAMGLPVDEATYQDQEPATQEQIGFGQTVVVALAPDPEIIKEEPQPQDMVGCAGKEEP